MTAGASRPVGSVRPGGRTSRTRQTVLAATRELLVTEGVAGMRMERIASLSGVHRSSIHRRWRGVAGIVADLASEIEASLEPRPEASLADGLREMAERMAMQLDGDGPALVRALLSWQDEEVRAVLDRFWQERRRGVALLLEGHQRSADPGLVLRLVAGPIHYEAVVEGRRPSSATIDAAVAAALSVV